MSVRITMPMRFTRLAVYTLAAGLALALAPLTAHAECRDGRLKSVSTCASGGVVDVRVRQVQVRPVVPGTVVQVNTRSYTGSGGVPVREYRRVMLEHKHDPTQPDTYYVGWYINPRPTPDTPAVPAAPAVPSEQMIREAVAQLRLPRLEAHLGPDPAWNEWNMLPVGYPIWLWVNLPEKPTTTVTSHGMTITVTANWAGTDFDMGDGNHQWCTDFSVYHRHQTSPGAPSPTCGYTYTTQNIYTITTRTLWQVTWTTPDASGTLITQTTAHRPLDVGELRSVIVNPNTPPHTPTPRIPRHTPK